MTTHPLPKIAACITRHVADFSVWKKAFEARAAERQDEGIVRLHVHRGVDDPNLVCVYLAALDRAGLDRFLGSEDLRPRHPVVELLVPQESRAPETNAPAAVFVSFDVESYDRWKAAFDAGLESRRRAGVVGHVVHRAAATSSPNRVVVLLLAESAEPLQAMFDGIELTSAMKKAGVCSPPELRFLRSADQEVA